MADDTPVPETLETIAASITALRSDMDRRFDETVAQLGVKIEAVEEKVTRVYDAVIALEGHKGANDRAHAGFASRLEDHDLRILAIEHPKPAKR